MKLNAMRIVVVNAKVSRVKIQNSRFYDIEGEEHIVVYHPQITETEEA